MMMITKTGLRKPFLALAFIGVMIFAIQGCGSSSDQQVAENRVGPAGPTSQNGLFFDLTVVPSTVQSGSDITVMFRVWDSFGNMVPNVQGALSGTAITPTQAFATTLSNGIGGWVVQLTSTAGSIVFVTVTVEDKSLTAPVQIMTDGTVPVSS